MTATTATAMISNNFYSVCEKAVMISGEGRTAYIHKMTNSNGIRRSTHYMASLDEECLVAAEGDSVALMAIYRDGLCRRWFVGE